MFTRLVSLSLLTALALAGSAGRALAADGKIVSPSACHPTGSVTTGLTYGAGHVTNNTGGNIDIICPIVRDVVTNGNGLTDLEIAVSDNSGTLSCEALSVDRTGAIGQSVPRSIPAAGHQIIDFGAALNTSSNKGHYAVICHTPAGAAIHSVYYEEGSETGADGKVIGASPCHPAGGGTTGLTYGAGHVTNTSGATMNVICPIVRDDATNQDGLVDLEIAVSDPTGTLSCDAVAVGRTGNILKSTTKNTPGTGARVIDFGTALNVSEDRGHYAIICRVPSKASIHSIYYGE
jgi:hypothetical protein